MPTDVRHHATPAAQSVLVAGRWFDEPGKAIEWAGHVATTYRVPMVVWSVQAGGPDRLKFLHGIEPA
jgi:hypothetical protein